MTRQLGLKVQERCEWSDNLDERLLDYHEKSKTPHTGVVCASQNGALFLCAMQDAREQLTSRPIGKGRIEFHLVSAVRKIKVVFNAAFRDRRAVFVPDNNIVEGALSRLELETDEPHPESTKLSPDSRSRDYEVRVVGIDSLGTTFVEPNNWSAIKLAFTSVAEQAPAILLNTTNKGQHSDVARSSFSASQILVYCTEWESGHGGLSSFNRELCRTLAALGHEVFIRIVETTSSSLKARLLHLRKCGSKEYEPAECDLRRIDLKPHFVVGHDRVTGVAMLEECKDLYPSAKICVFIHIDPAINAFGDDGDMDAGEKIARKIEQQRLVLKGSTVAGTIGPRLYRYAQGRISGFSKAAALVNIAPGFADRGEVPNSDYAKVFRCIFIARPNDVRLKGREVAIGAFKKATESVGLRKLLAPMPGQVTLGICGVKEDELAELNRRHGNSAWISPYTVNTETVAEEFRRAHLVLMPSFEEGFGLVALEALEANRPVLVTANSGIAEWLCTMPEICDAAEALIVREPDDLDSADIVERRVTIWAERIVNSIQDYAVLQKKVEQIRQHLMKTSWSDAIGPFLREMEARQ